MRKTLTLVSIALAVLSAAPRDRGGATGGAGREELERRPARDAGVRLRAGALENGGEHVGSAQGRGRRGALGSHGRGDGAAGAVPRRSENRGGGAAAGKRAQTARGDRRPRRGDRRAAGEGAHRSGEARGRGGNAGARGAPCGRGTAR